MGGWLTAGWGCGHTPALCSVSSLCLHRLPPHLQTALPHMSTGPRPEAAQLQCSPLFQPGGLSWFSPSSSPHLRAVAWSQSSRDLRFPPGPALNSAVMAAGGCSPCSSKVWARVMVSAPISTRALVVELYERTGMCSQWKFSVSNFFLLVGSRSGGSHYIHTMGSYPTARLKAHVVVDLTIFVTSSIRLQCSGCVSSRDLSIKHLCPLTFSLGWKLLTVRRTAFAVSYLRSPQPSIGDLLSE